MTTETRDINRNVWRHYLSKRVGTYEWRTLRFAEVWDDLEYVIDRMQPHDMIVDVGAGMCDFARYIYSTKAFEGQYLAVDGAIDGTDLEAWRPTFHAEYFVCIETIEHLQEHHARELLEAIKEMCTKGVVLTTPNPEVWIAEVGSVANLDPTHRCYFYAQELEELGFKTRTHNLFGKPNDTIIATYVKER